MEWLMRAFLFLAVALSMIIGLLLFIAFKVADIYKALK